MIFVRCWIADKAFADGSHCTRRSRWPSVHPRQQLGCLFVGEYVILETFLLLPLSKFHNKHHCLCFCNSVFVEKLCR